MSEDVKDTNWTTAVVKYASEEDKKLGLVEHVLYETKDDNDTTKQADESLDL